MSLLSNGGLYEKARKIIFENFYLKAIVKLGSNAFQATGTNTVILFLQKRDKAVILDTKEDYIKLASNGDKILIVDTGEKESEKKFLGYSFSNRRGNEGITEERDGDNQYLGSLMDKKNRDNKDKVNYYILQAILNNYPSVSNELKNNIYSINLEDAFNFEADNFMNTVSLSKKKRIISKYPLRTLENYLIDCNIGTIKILKKYIKKEGKYPVITQETSKLIAGYSSEENPVSNLPIVLFGDHTGIVKYIDFEFHRGADGTQLYKTYEEKLLLKYFYFLMKISDLLKVSHYRRHSKILRKLRIPLPPIEKQKEIVSLMEEQENIISKEEKIIEEENNKINDLDFFQYETVDLGELVEIVIGGTPNRRNRAYYYNGKYLWLSISEMHGNVIYDTKEKINDLGVQKSNVKLIPKNTILLSFKLSIGRVAISGKDLYTNEAIAGLIPKNKRFIQKYLFYLLKYKFNDLQTSIKDNVFGSSLNKKTIYKIKIPLPSIEEQNKIISQFEIYKQKIEQSKDKITKAKEKQKEIINDIIQIY